MSDCVRRPDELNDHASALQCGRAGGVVTLLPLEVMEEVEDYDVIPDGSALQQDRNSTSGSSTFNKDPALSI